MVSLHPFCFTQFFLHTVASVKCQSALITLMLRTLQWLLLIKDYKKPCIIWCLGVSSASSLTTLPLVCAALSTLALQEEVCSCLKGAAHYSPFWDVHLYVLVYSLTSVMCLLKCHPLTGLPYPWSLWNSHHHHCLSFPLLYSFLVLNVTWCYLVIVLPHDIRVPESHRAMQNCTTGFNGENVLRNNIQTHCRWPFKKERNLTKIVA